MKASLPAAVTKVTTMRDRTIRLQVDCQEVPPESMTELFELNDCLGHFFFQKERITQINLSKLPKIELEPDEKSPGQRLRSVLFLLHKQNGGKDEDFDPFYRKQMERFIGAVKERLV